MNNLKIKYLIGICFISCFNFFQIKASDNPVRINDLTVTSKRQNERGCIYEIQNGPNGLRSVFISNNGTQIENYRRKSVFYYRNGNVETIFK